VACEYTNYIRQTIAELWQKDSRKVSILSLSNMVTYIPHEALEVPGDIIEVCSPYDIKAYAAQANLLDGQSMVEKAYGPMSEL
jgi:hypothetical protein